MEENIINLKLLTRIRISDCVLAFSFGVIGGIFLALAVMAWGRV